MVGCVSVRVEGGSHDLVVERGVEGLEAFEVLVPFGESRHVLGVVQLIEFL